jgi:iron complex transport system substrate-binding protein
VITAAPSFTEIAFALGRGDRVVGVSDFCERPPRACRLPRIGGLVDPDLERILALRPDLVVLLGDFPEADAPLRRAGVRTLLLDNESIGDVFHVIETLGEALDARESARALARRMRGDLDAVKRRVAGEPRPRVLWVLDRRPGTVQDVFAAGGGSFLTEILEVAGGHSVLADTRQGAIQISTEQLLRSGADVVLDSSSDPAGTLPWRTLPALPAVGNGRLVAVRDPVFTVPGPRIARAAERVARLLHPDLFPTEAR